MEIWTAFLIGLAGSFHCIGMCGPIVLALPPGSGKGALITGRLLYNLGRALTYAAMGAVSGLIGKTIMMGGYQQTLSIALGVLLILAIVVPSRVTRIVAGENAYALLIGRMKSIWSRLIGNGSAGSLLGIGLLNGLLPCGLVYVALAGAATTGSASSGALYMFTFGLGTVPMMLLASLATGLIAPSVRRAVNRALPFGGVVLATLLILRGLSLGIPYISPKIEKTTAEGSIVHPCCEQADSTATPGSHP